MSKKEGWGGKRANSGRKPIVREAELPPAPGEAFSTASLPDLTDTDVRRILATILLNPQMPPTARVSAGRALLGRDAGDTVETSAESKLHQHALEILHGRMN
jgi:hypothetical protein